MPWPGDIVRVWEAKGLARNKYGEIAANETMNTSIGRVNPSDELEILSKHPHRNDHFFVRRLSDDLEFVIHPNHYDPGTAYNLRNRRPTKAMEVQHLAQQTLNRQRNP